MFTPKAFLQACFIIVTFTPYVALASEGSAIFSLDSSKANSGQILVSFGNCPAPATLQITDSGKDSWQNLYSGHKNVYFISGLADGSYTFRLKCSGEDFTAWQVSDAVTVKHHSLKLALYLFLVGLVVVLATVILIVAGSLKYRQEETS